MLFFMKFKDFMKFDGMMKPWDELDDIDIIFFISDSFFAISAPFAGGGLKIGTQSFKLTIERLFLNSEGNILEMLFLRMDYEDVTWSLGKIIYENLFNKPIIEYIRDLKDDAFNQMLHYVFSVSFDHVYNEN